MEYLPRACSTAGKNYGKDTPVTRSLMDLYSREESAASSYERQSTKNQATTKILEQNLKNNYQVSVYYSWEEERIVAQLIKLKPRREVTSEQVYDVALDIAKLKLLRDGEWLSVHRGMVEISEPELLQLLGVTDTPESKEMTTCIDRRHFLSRNFIVKKDSISSSSSGGADIFDNEEFKFMKFGRSQSSKKHKETQ